MLADKIEQIRREELEILQLERLKKIVEWAYDRSAFYRRTFQAHGVKPDDIQNLDDVNKLPFLTFDDLHQNDALDFLTLPLSNIVRINHFNGCGERITKLYTKGDIRNNVEMMIRAFMAADVLRGSVVGIQGDFADSKFLDVLYALESIGATIIPLGTDCRQQLELTERFGINTLIGTPQFIMQLIQDLSDCSFTKIFCLNTANIFDTLRFTATKIFNLFAPPELGHAGLLYQCTDAAGLHVQEDHFLIELSERGELIITTLTAQALPLIRYRTGQTVRRMSEPCSCGRTFMRLAAPHTND